jgi:VanZ family protein
MTDPHREADLKSPILAILSGLILCGMLLAGLLPFRGPRNGVTWLGDQNGIRLTDHSTIWSAAAFPVLDSRAGDSCTMELWLQPAAQYDSNVILAFSTPQNPVQLVLFQYRSVLILETRVPGRWGPASIMGTDGVLHQGTLALVTISSGPRQTAIYVNGVLARVFPGSRIASDCSGRLVLGTSPRADDSWHGQLRGLALYGTELKADQVRHHYNDWYKSGSPAPVDAEQSVAIYPFNERSGSVVHNTVSGGIDLEIPARYSLIHQIFLRPFWHEYKPGWSYWQDILINIFGFMPLGFFFYAYCTSARPLKRAVLAVTLLGLAISLTIEVTQSFIPTRDSGTTDLITNTFGTFLGIQLYRWSFARAILARISSLRAL